MPVGQRPRADRKISGPSRALWDMEKARGFGPSLLEEDSQGLKGWGAWQEPPESPRSGLVGEPCLGGR